MNSKEASKSAGKRNKNQNSSPSNLAQLKAQLMREIRRETSSRRLENKSNRRGANFGQPKLVGPGNFSSAPVAIDRMVRTGRPQMSSKASGDCRIVHREYIADIKASTSTPTIFGVTSFPINPGQSSSFPWLSSIAGRFESYHFNKLNFLFESEAASTLGGSLVLAVDYDANDAAPLSKQQALAYRESVRSAPWKECKHTSLKEDLSKLKTNFVRPGNQPPNTDAKLYDVGTLYVVTQGVTTASAVCGELYVEYDVELMTPVLNPNSSNILQIFVASSTAAAPFTSAVFSGGIGGAVGATATTLSLTNLIAGGEYIVYCGGQTAAGAGITFGAFSASLTQGTALADSGNTTGTTFTVGSGFTSGTFTIVPAATITNAVYSVYLSPGGLPAGF